MKKQLTILAIIINLISFGQNHYQTNAGNPKDNTNTVINSGEKKFFNIGLGMAAGIKNMKYIYNDSYYDSFSHLYDENYEYSFTDVVIHPEISMFFNISEGFSFFLNPSIETMAWEEMTLYLPLNAVIYPNRKFGIIAGTGLAIGNDITNEGALFNLGVLYHLNNNLTFSLIHYRYKYDWIENPSYSSIAHVKNRAFIFSFNYLFTGNRKVEKNKVKNDNFAPNNTPSIENQNIIDKQKNITPIEKKDYSEYSTVRLKELLEEAINAEDYTIAEQIQAELSKREAGKKYENMTIEQLNTELMNAIENEKYEEAEIIQNEINKRK